LSLLEARKISLQVEARHILDHISLEAREGEFIGIIGPNGAGKSTFIKCVSGLARHTEGQVYLEGRDLAQMSARQIARVIAHLPQNTYLDFGFTCLEVVLMGRNPHLGPFQLEGRKDHHIANEAMAFTNTAQFASRTVDTLSGGERQRVLISRALAQQPRLLLLDEPTANLDIQHQLHVMDLVRRLVDDGMTALAAMHDLALAARYCDRLVLLSAGKVVADGKPWDVLTPQNIETVFGVKALVYTDPVTGSLTVSVLTSSDGQLTSPGVITQVHVIAGGGHGSRAMYLLREAGFQVTAGVLSQGDSDYHTAQKLNIYCPCVPPFSHIDHIHRTQHQRLIDQADVVVVTSTQFGDANYSNLEDAAAARRLVLVEEGPFADRDFTGGKATALYQQMRQRAITTSLSGLVDAVAQVLASNPLSSSAAPGIDN
jgi:iron complex transport system ATP-binding protein